MFWRDLRLICRDRRDHVARIAAWEIGSGEEPQLFRVAKQTGTLAAGGTHLGILIAVSFILIILSDLLAEQSIIKLFAAAVIPGIIAAIGYMIFFAIYVLVPGQAENSRKQPGRGRARP